MTFRTIAVVLVGTLCLSLAAAAELVRAGSQSKQPVAQRADGGFWRTDQGFKSELVLTNVVKTESVVVTPVLYLALGTRYQLAPVTLPPLGVARVSINDALADGSCGSSIAFGRFGERLDRIYWPVAICDGVCKRSRRRPQSCFHI